MKNQKNLGFGRNLNAYGAFRTTIWVVMVVLIGAVLCVNGVSEAIFTSELREGLIAYYPMDENSGTRVYNILNSSQYNWTTDNNWSSGLIRGSNGQVVCEIGTPTKVTNINPNTSWSGLSIKVYYNRTSAWTNNQAPFSYPYNVPDPFTNGQFKVVGVNCVEGADYLGIDLHDLSSRHCQDICIKVIADSTFHQLVITFNSTTATISNETTTKSCNLDNFIVGGDVNSIGVSGATATSNYCLKNTWFDEMGVWNRSLTLSEISKLWNEGLGISISPQENSQTYNSSTYETSSESFILNMTYDSSYYTSASANLIYNETTYTGTKVGTGDTVLFTRTLTMPSVSADTNKSFYWNIILYNGATLEYYNSTFKNQTVKNTNISSAGEALAINFTIYDEVTRLPINSNFRATFWWSLGSSLTKDQNISFDLGASQQFLLNITPKDRTFYVDAFIRLENATNYESRRINLRNLILTNATTLQKLYLLPENNGTNIIIQIKDEGLQPLESYLIKIYRYYPEINQYIMVESQETDNFGQIVAYLVEKEVKYKIEIYDTSDNLVKTILNYNPACRTAICIQEFVVTETEDYFSIYGKVKEYEGSLTWNNNTNTFTFIWNTNASAVYRLEVKRNSWNGTQIVCNETSASSESGSLICAVGSTKADYTAQVYRITSPSERIASLSSSVGDYSSTFGVEGLLWSFVLLMTLIIIGHFNPPIGVILYLGGIILLSIIDIIYLNPAIIVAELVLGALFIWAFRS